METQLNVKLQMNYLQNDNWAFLQKWRRVINWSYIIFKLATIPHLNKCWCVWARASVIARHSLQAWETKPLFVCPETSECLFSRR